MSSLMKVYTAAAIQAAKKLSETAADYAADPSLRNGVRMSAAAAEAARAEAQLRVVEVQNL
jgi:hypothetical protein